MACYYVVISSTHLRDGKLRSIKGLFRGPIGARARSMVEKGSSLYCELCDKQYERQQQFDNHTSSYDHHHRQRLKELKQREFYRMLSSRRQRRSQEQEKGYAHRVPGPVFHRTTALDKSLDQTSCSKEPVIPQVWSSSHWLSSSPAERDLSITDITTIKLETSHTQTNVLDQTIQPEDVNKQPELLPHAAPSLATNITSDGCGLSGTNTHNAHSDTRVSFSLPKRNCMLRHQSAAVFLQTTTPKETQPPQNIVNLNLDPPVNFKYPTDPVIGANLAQKATQKELKDFQEHTSQSTSFQRPEEPFCQVLSRDGTTVLLWPSEMVSYTRTAPSISFSVNPLLHNFRAKNTIKDVPMNKGEELGRKEPCVIKQAKQEQRQADAPGGGLLSRLESKLEHGGGQAATAGEVVSHGISSNCDENVLKCLVHSEFKQRSKRRRRKIRKRGKRPARVRNKRQRIKSKTMTNGSAQRKGLERQNIANPKPVRKDLEASNGHKKIERLSDLPVSHFNRCEQLCAQVNNQASHHLSLQSASEWSPGFRKLPSRGAACNAAISLVPGSDIEKPRCLAITPIPVQSGTVVWETHAETQSGKNSMILENVATGHELLRKRTFDESLNLDTLCDQAQTVLVKQPTADHTSHSLQLPQIDVHCTPNTEVLTNGKTSGVSPMTNAPPMKIQKSEKYIGNCLDLLYLCSDLNIQNVCSPQEIQKTKQPLTQIVERKNISHFVSEQSEQAGTAAHSCCHSARGNRQNDGTTENSTSYPHNNSASKKFFVTQGEPNDRYIPNVTTENKIQVEPRQHCQATGSTTLTDMITEDVHNCRYDCTNHLTNCNSSDKGNGVVVLIRTQSDQRRRNDQKQKPTSEGAWLGFPRPQPLFLHPHFQPLSLPISPLTPIPTHFSAHPAPFAPLLPTAFNALAPVPLLHRPPYPLPTFSMQTGGSTMYSLPPPPFVPMQFMSSKETTFSIYWAN